MAILINPVIDEIELFHLLDLMRAHFDEFAAVRPEFRPAQNWLDVYAEGAKAAITNPRHRQVLAWVDQVPVGTCVSFWREDPILGQRVGIISELYVTPDRRGSGVGRGLARDAINWLTESGAGFLSLRTPALGSQSDAGFALTGDAIRFWSSLGFRAEALVMRLDRAAQ